MRHGILRPGDLVAALRGRGAAGCLDASHCGDRYPTAANRCGLRTSRKTNRPREPPEALGAGRFGTGRVAQFSFVQWLSNAWSRMPITEMVSPQTFTGMWIGICTLFPETMPGES